MNNQFNGIWSDPEIHGGQPLIAGDRIPVYLILRMLAQGMTPAEIVANYDITETHIYAALAFAADYLEQTTWQ